ncbi:GNAT family N-acetyltransferase [Sporosarcina sp. Marseille-Q4063]|uniref:GNAT family N-acetyltransferase n=1 Tax=Sporosarcina sp. Marseille-Q4063 TaxID=2810514 RepID=UPI001BAFB415|nr:GNAT family N-acetyltransferase [Sporosarcina sp. Marseille-Q4063]QUW23624.1 GNAT family N-acetyltransferase [Sporosarcina sp. Marseille-Q4063]
MKFRRAIIDDAAGIAKVHVDSWRTTYNGIIPNDFLNKLTYEQRTELWKANIAREENYVVIAENNEAQIIGFADAWKRENNVVENSGDLTSIYLLEEYQGKGIGKRLFKELFKHFKKMDYEKVFVEVLEDNKTRYFYEYYGAKLVKIVQIKIGGKILNELIYEWNNVDEVLDKI